MNVMTAHWIAIGRLEDIPKRGARCVRNGSMTIAVFRTEDDRVFVRGVFPDGTVLIDRGPQRVTVGQRVVLNTAE